MVTRPTNDAHGRWSIRRRLTVGFLAVVVLCGIGMGITRAAEASAERALREVGALAEAGRHLSRVGALVREFYMHQAHLALGLETHEHVGHTRGARRQLDTALTALEAAPSAPPDASKLVRTRLTALDDLFERRFLPAHHAGRHEEANRAHFEAVEQVQALVDALQAEEVRIAERIEAAQAAATAAGRRAATLSTTAIAVAILCGVLVAAHVTRAVTLPVDTLRDAAAAVGHAPDGAQVPEAGPPELAALGRSINGMLRDLESHRQARAAAETMATLGRVAGGIAHEINNPLGVILGHARLIERGGGEGAADARTIAEEARHCQAIVKALLDYARPGTLQRDEVELAELVGTVADRHERCVVEVAPSLRVRGDRARLRQLFANLVDNGLAFGESVTVRAEAAASDGRAGVRIAVLDDGPGVPEVDRGQVFEPFFSKRVGGTGLGLAIARAVVDAHGGTLEVTARDDGPGAAFVAWLPASEAAA